MPYTVVVVDDSNFYRRRLTSLLQESSELEVVGQARDGKEAVELAVKLRPDVMTMDVEMPNMNGVDAVSEIMRVCPTSILMISSLTQDGAQATLASLEAGALDYIAKNFDDICESRRDAISHIQEKVIALARANKRSLGHQQTKLRRVVERGTAATLGRTAPFKPAESNTPARSFDGRKRYKLLTIAASTGGPQALQDLIAQLPQDFDYPILLLQHMPGTFTEAFAKRLDQTANVRVKLAQDGDILSPGVAYLAPGGFQTRISGRGRFARLIIEPSPTHKKLVFEPSIDYTFESIASSFDGDVLAIILTGMGNDGTAGAGVLKKQGATIWTQDEASCVVYGMPKAVLLSGNSDRVIQLSEMARDLLLEMSN